MSMRVSVDKSILIIHTESLFHLEFDFHPNQGICLLTYPLLSMLRLSSLNQFVAKILFRLGAASSH